MLILSVAPSRPWEGNQFLNLKLPRIIFSSKVTAVSLGWSWPTRNNSYHMFDSPRPIDATAYCVPPDGMRLCWSVADRVARVEFGSKMVSCMFPPTKVHNTCFQGSSFIPYATGRHLLPSILKRLLFLLLSTRLLVTNLYSRFPVISRLERMPLNGIEYCRYW